MRITIRDPGGRIRADICDGVNSELPSRTELGEGVAVVVEGGSDSLGMFPLSNDGIHLLLQVSTAVGTGVVANWLWQKIRAKQARVLIEREEYIVTSETELQKIVYERWRLERH